MLQTGSGALALDAANVSACQLTCQMGVFGKVLKIPSVERMAFDVHTRRQKNIHASGFGFRAEGFSEFEDEVAVKGARDSREARVACGRDARIQTRLIVFGHYSSQAVRSMMVGLRGDAQRGIRVCVRKVSSA